MQDIETKQQTLFSEFIFNHAEEKDKNEFKNYFGCILNKSQKQQVYHILQQSRAIDNVQDSMENYFKKANDEIKNIEKINQSLCEKILKTVIKRTR